MVHAHGRLRKGVLYHVAENFNVLQFCGMLVLLGLGLGLFSELLASDYVFRKLGICHLSLHCQMPTHAAEIHTHTQKNETL